jgi:hypothetical protein
LGKLDHRIDNDESPADFVCLELDGKMPSSSAARRRRTLPNSSKRENLAGESRKSIPRPAEKEEPESGCRISKGAARLHPPRMNISALSLKVTYL